MGALPSYHALFELSLRLCVEYTVEICFLACLNEFKIVFFSYFILTELKTILK